MESQNTRENGVRFGSKVRVLSFTDYLALTKPKIVPLLLLAAVGSSVVAARAIPPLPILLGVLLGGTFASAGALALNSYLEMGIDARMKRTRNRPLPAMRVVPPSQALVLGLGLLAAGIGVALLTLNILATFFIALGAIIYVPIYTVVLKPRTSWNIVLGGFAGSCASLAGWYAVTSSYAVVGWILGALVFVWTPTHFWSLAVITEEDYSAVGIPMLPSEVGPRAASKYIVANTLLLIPVSLLFAFYLAGISLFVYLVVAVVFDSFLLATNLKLLRTPNKENAWLAFKFSSPYLAVIFLAAMVAAVLPA
jgi:protoheme IX farnesyltransferase